MLKFSGVKFKEVIVEPGDVDARAELLLLSPSILVPCLSHNGSKVWDTLAIGEYLNEIAPNAGLLPTNPVHRAHCRSICGEMHSGFDALRGALPMNIKARIKGFKVWSKAQSDIDRILLIWRDCLQTYQGPFLFGETPGIADAMFAPVVLRFLTYGITVDAACQAYCDHILALPEMKQWIAAAIEEPEDIEELQVEF